MKKTEIVKFGEIWKNQIIIILIKNNLKLNQIILISTKGALKN
jgi:hypothetical protein